MPCGTPIALTFPCLAVFWGMANRDEFSPGVKRALALRAAYRCSLCDGPTAGPSDEGIMAVAITGIAAHICAAAPGGRRYDPDMSTSERGGFANGIWLFATHAGLVDRDEVTYTRDTLRLMKRNHEQRCQAAQASTSNGSAASANLLAFGSTAIAYGAITRVQGSTWTITIEHFVVGSLADLIGMSETFAFTAPYDRYVIVNSLGDGRSLASALIVEQVNGIVMLTASVEPSFPRLAANALPRDYAVSAAHDLFTEGGNIATVSGVAALPQRILSCLSMQRGESPFHQDFGSRFSEYYALFNGSPWLDELLKLEVIRLAAIPYNDPLLGHSYTPLQSVERVLAVTILGPPEQERLPVRLDLQVAGEGAWSRELAIFV